MKSDIPALRESIGFGDETVTFINNYGGDCRDCADGNGICPTSGLPCADRVKAIRHVLDALAYGINHGFLNMIPVAERVPPVHMPELPIKIFDQGPWIWKPTNETFTGAQLDTAAFHEYQRALMPKG